jgi:hypothetical protein
MKNDQEEEEEITTDKLRERERERVTNQLKQTIVGDFGAESKKQIADRSTKVRDATSCAYFF